jgi:hypothetical protein
MIQGVTLSFICWIDQFNDYHQQDAHPEVEEVKQSR